MSPPPPPQLSSPLRLPCEQSPFDFPKVVDERGYNGLREKHCFYCFSDWYFTLMVGQLCFRPFFASLTNLISLQQLLTHQGTGSDCLSYRKCLKLTALFCISSHTKVNFLSFKESLLLNSSYRWLSIFRGQNSEDPREIAFRGWKRNIEYWILNIEFRLVWIFKNSV